MPCTFMAVPVFRHLIDFHIRLGRVASFHHGNTLVQYDPHSQRLMSFDHTFHSRGQSGNGHCRHEYQAKSAILGIIGVIKHFMIDTPLSCKQRIKASGRIGVHNMPSVTGFSKPLAYRPLPQHLPCVQRQLQLFLHTSGYIHCLK